MKTLVSLILGMSLIAGVARAEQDDPMESLFRFQQKMAASGSTAAMMKLGELYEEGQGTEQDFDKAIEMYRMAGQHGDARAEAAIKRAQKRKMASSSAAQKAREAQQQKREQARKERQRRLSREKAAQEKARRAALEKKRKEEATRKRAAAEKARQAGLEKKRRADEKRSNEEKAKIRKARSDALSKAKAKEAAKTEKSEEGFKSNPCRGAAARVMSICKGK